MNVMYGVQLFIFIFVFPGILVLLSLGFLTPSFYYIPKASLAAVIISAVMSMIEVQTLLPMWRISRNFPIIHLAQLHALN